MSGKYQILQPIGQGQSGTVYLTRHLNLDVERAIKVIPYTETSLLQILEEAKLLKAFHHPGIPVIYDVEQDEEFIYLVEEYINGESLPEFFSHQTFISPELIYSYFLQLCDIFRYLHSYSNRPFFYQDLKPDHIIVQGDTLKLIDYGVCSCDRESKITICGNGAFSAPEVLNGFTPTLRSEVYSLGKILIYLLDHSSEEYFPKLIPIYQKATCTDPKLRYETVEALEAAVKLTRKETTGRTSCKSIAVIGSYHGCGATHFGISLTCALNFSGIKSVYMEKNRGDAIRKMAQLGFPLEYEAGLYRYRNFTGMPLYGPGIRLEDFSDFTCIQDFGCEFALNDLSSSDQIVLLADSSPWHLHHVIEMNEYLLPFKGRLTILCNSDTAQSARILSKNIRQKVFLYPRDPEVFLVTKEKQKFFKKLLRL